MHLEQFLILVILEAAYNGDEICIVHPDAYQMSVKAGWGRKEVFFCRPIRSELLSVRVDLLVVPEHTVAEFSNEYRDIVRHDVKKIVQFKMEPE
jgi:hypothetical protein